MGTQRFISARVNPRRTLASGLLALAAASLALAPSLADGGTRPAVPTRPAAPAAGQGSGGLIESVAVPIGDTGFSRGRSTVTVQAPIERVRAAVLGFARYPEFMPHYEACRVLGRTKGGGRDVYMEVSALRGAVKMWARVEFMKAASADGVETYAARFLDGNVHDFQAMWRLEKIDEARTRLSLEVFLRPKIPLPRGLINSENLDGSARGVAAMRARAEGAVAQR